MNRTVATALVVAAGILLLGTSSYTSPDHRDVKPAKDVYLQDDHRSGCPECEPRGGERRT